ncbi:MAG: DUF1330 domain-containing protein [Bacteroidota bacterium]
MKRYIHPKEESVKEFNRQYKGKGPLPMLNLLKLRPIADYSEVPDLAPSDTISGEAAYQIYMTAVSHEINKIGAKMRMMGKCSNFLIGPETEEWDMMLVVEYPSVEAFIGFSQSEAYQNNVGHRTAALEDSRLLPFQ